MQIPVQYLLWCNVQVPRQYLLWCNMQIRNAIVYRHEVRGAFTLALASIVNRHGQSWPHSHACLCVCYIVNALQSLFQRSAIRRPTLCNTWTNVRQSVMQSAAVCCTMMQIFGPGSVGCLIFFCTEFDCPDFGLLWPWAE